MFVDQVKITITAGNGGSGIVCYRHEKYIAKGGPYGGDGGNGGSIIFQATNNLNTLAHFRHLKELKATNGSDGGNKKLHGKNGEDLIISVPYGTIIRDEQGTILTDLTPENPSYHALTGGKGGYGNAHFISSTRKCPNFCEFGEPATSLKLDLELKILANIGLVGLPSVGKSSLINILSSARPKIADYPFTTIIPNLGICSMTQWGGKPEQSLIIADLPGIITGANLGKGLGLRFLKHIERTTLLVHIIDISAQNYNDNFTTILNEMQQFSPNLLRKPQIIVLNKTDLLSTNEVNERHQLLQELIKKKYPKLNINKTIYNIAIIKKQGIKELIWAIYHDYQTWQIANQAHLTAQTAQKNANQIKIYKPYEDNPKNFKLHIDDQGTAHISGTRIEQIAAMTDWENNEAINRIYDIMHKNRITHELIRAQIKEGQIIYIGTHPLKFFNLS